MSSNQSKLEHVERLAARCLSDVRRGVAFDHGMRHFAEMVLYSTRFMVEMVEQIDKTSKKG